MYYTPYRECVLFPAQPTATHGNIWTAAYGNKLQRDATRAATHCCTLLLMFSMENFCLFLKNTSNTKQQRDDHTSKKK